MGIKPKQHDDFFITLSMLLFAITSSVNRTSSRRLRNHPFLKDCMIQGDIHFFAEKDCSYEYNIILLCLRCLSPYATEIRYLFENVKTVSEYMEEQN